MPESDAREEYRKFQRATEEAQRSPSPAAFKQEERGALGSRNLRSRCAVAAVSAIEDQEGCRPRSRRASTFRVIASIQNLFRK